MFAAILSVAWIGTPAGATVAADSGRFVLTIQGTKLGTDTFTIQTDGSSVADVAVTIGGVSQTIHETITIRDGSVKAVSADAGHGNRYDAVVSGGKVTIARGKLPAVYQDVPAHYAPFGNYSPHLMAYVLAAYDAKRGGPQTLDMVLIEGLGPKGFVSFKGSLQSDGARTATVQGKALTVTGYRLTLAGPAGDIQMDLTADTQGRLLAWRVPGQSYLAVREGYEELVSLQAAADPLLSKPRFEVTTDAAVKVPMRDGITLVATLYRPKEPGKYPVILQRSPYGRKGGSFQAQYFARRGYACVIQDVRGRYDSPGEWHPFVSEARDGYDTIEWCARQPWSNGDVGMIGGSYLGFVQWAAAREGSSHLKCIIPIVSPPDPFYNIPYAYGAFFLGGSLWWGAAVQGKTLSFGTDLNHPKAYSALPLRDVDLKLLGHHIPFFQEWLRHPTDDAYWQQVDFEQRMAKIGPLPALHVSGWFDGDGIGTKRNYARMVATGHTNQKLVYGPWPHALNSTTKLGELDFGPKSLRDLDTLYLRWFDRWLKGIRNGVDTEPPVDAFLMGANEWRTFSAWPPPEAKPTRWYLHSAGTANGVHGGGSLSPAPSGAEPPDRYTYDPAHPFTIGDLGESPNKGPETRSLDIGKSLGNQGVLVYTTANLKTDVVVAGPISLHLFAATSARDTDWMAILTDVTPDGKSLALCSGVIRARYRNSSQRPSLLKPNAVNDYTLDLWALGHVFRAGHRIRIVVTSSLFPNFDRNLNTGEDIATGTRMVVARQRVLHDRTHSSYLVLPTLPR
jgi:putative CocE/NonD family hydrolase